MTTYKQPIKEKSRELIWNHAIKSLTSKRDANRILNASYTERLWLYCQQVLKEDLDIEAFVKWKEYADICYGHRSPQELKVAFFCGNEPENDVSHLLRLGVRIENIYAFECDSKLFKEAVNSLHTSYPLLKIYKGMIEDYADLQNTKFDIVYLDFTGSLLKEYKTVAKLFDLNALTDMSILIVNTSYPDKTDKNIEALTKFFYHDTFFEMSVIDRKEVEREEGDTWFYRCEGCDSYGIDEERLYQLVEANFDHAYSAFQTAFLLDYANRHKAYYEVFKQNTLLRRLINTNTTPKSEDYKENFHTVLQQEYFEDGQRLSSNQFPDDAFMTKRENGALYSRLESIELAEVFLQSPYNHSKEDSNNDYIDVNFRDILSQEVRDVIDNIDRWFYKKFNFCDMPMAHLWLELLMNQFGHPYHTNIENHRRFCYTAKTRKMCIDIFTLDKCRALYDWIPMLEYFIHDMQNRDRQMITRMCIDAIDKHLLHIVDEIYYGGALVGINEFEWSKNKVLPNRINLGEPRKKSNVIIQIFNKILSCFRK